MKDCEGLGEWIRCLRCTYLCTARCPLEGKDVMERLASWYRRREAERAANDDGRRYSLNFKK
ncbi:MAG: hypothetical protein P8Y66_10645 [Nitrospirota bacterium]|jgi:hypothetical protein